jgi:structural maintenance of chromosome 2
LLTQKVAELKSKIAQLDFSPEEYEGLEQEVSTRQSSVNELTERINTLQLQLDNRLRFDYTDPVRGFDRNKVKGLLAKLIEVRQYKHVTALEVVAGGKLFQVVVDEAITGKALLDRGKLQKRVTIIPLDKIQPRQVGANAAKRAEEIAVSLQATANPAIELVGFDEEVRNAVEYVFGSTIVVDDMKAANQICDATKTRTVTLEGDVYDPSGTISGGSSSQLGTTLSRLTELSDAMKKLQIQKPNLERTLKKIETLKVASVSYDKLNAKLEIVQAELDAAEKHLSQTNFGMLIEKRDSCIAAIEAEEHVVVLMSKQKEVKWKLHEELKSQEAELTKLREDRLIDIERAVNAAKVATTKATALAREAMSRSQTLTLELESLENEVIAAKEAVLVAENVLCVATIDESESQMQVGDISASYEETRQELDELEQKMSEYNSGVSDLKRAKVDLLRAAEAAKLESKKLSVNVLRIKKERASAEKVVSSMLKSYAWIEGEMNAFGVRGGDYDFEATDPNEVTQQLKMLKNEQDALVSYYLTF